MQFRFPTAKTLEMQLWYWEFFWMDGKEQVKTMQSSANAQGLLQSAVSTARYFAILLAKKSPLWKSNSRNTCYPGRCSFPFVYLSITKWGKLTKARIFIGGCQGTVHATLVSRQCVMILTSQHHCEASCTEHWLMWPWQSPKGCETKHAHKLLVLTSQYSSYIWELRNCLFKKTLVHNLPDLLTISKVLLGPKAKRKIWFEEFPPAR